MIQRIADVCTALLKRVRRWWARRRVPLPPGYDADELEEVNARRRRITARMREALEEARRPPGQASTQVRVTHRPAGRPYW